MSQHRARAANRSRARRTPGPWQHLPASTYAHRVAWWRNPNATIHLFAGVDPATGEPADPCQTCGHDATDHVADDGPCWHDGCRCTRLREPALAP